MTTTHVSQHAESVPKSRKWTRRKVLVVSGVVGAMLIPVAAWAAIQLFGFGTLDSAAATTENLTVNNNSAQLTGKLVPGQTVGAKAVVTNPNDFPVTVTGVIVHNSTLMVTPAGSDMKTGCANTVHVIGDPATWPGSGDTAGTLQSIGENVVIQPGQSAWVTVPQAVKQDAAGTTLCGIHAEFAVRAQTAS